MLQGIQWPSLRINRIKPPYSLYLKLRCSSFPAFSSLVETYALKTCSNARQLTETSLAQEEFLLPHKSYKILFPGSSLAPCVHNLWNKEESLTFISVCIYIVQLCVFLYNNAVCRCRGLSVPELNRLRQALIKPHEDLFIIAKRKFPGNFYRS